jgi:integrase
VAAGGDWNDRHGDLVFRQPDGNPISGNHLARTLQRVLIGAGLPAIRFHDLRHATATFLAVEKVPVAVAMAVLGHANASTTLEIYTRVAPDLAREAAEAMDRVLATHAEQ